MSPDLDPAIEAAAQALCDWDREPGQPYYDEESPLNRDAWTRQATDVLAAAAPLIRAQERAAVAGELFVMAREYDVNDDDWPGSAMLRKAARRIAAEHTTPREKP